MCSNGDVKFVTNRSIRYIAGLTAFVLICICLTVAGADGAIVVARLSACAGELFQRSRERSLCGSRSRRCGFFKGVAEFSELRGRLHWGGPAAGLGEDGDVSDHQEREGGEKTFQGIGKGRGSLGWGTYFLMIRVGRAHSFAEISRIL